METNIDEAMRLCLLELQRRGYSKNFLRTVQRNWKALAAWMKERSIDRIDEAAVERYCLESFDMFLLKPGTSWQIQKKLRSVRMLLSYAIRGDFDFRTPQVRRELEGQVGELAVQFLDHQREMGRKESTLQNKKWHLYLFCSFLNCRNVSCDKLAAADIEDFLKDPRTQRTDTVGCASTVRQFLNFLHEKGHCKADLGWLLSKVKPKGGTKLPSTYTPEEVKRILMAVDRGSATGKRDYLILLLASQYGLRASDIRDLRFSDIDWDNNMITRQMCKTGETIKLDLLPSVGNAVIDYLKYGRPKCATTQVIVSHDNVNKGAPIGSSLIHSIVAKHIRKAEIAGWTEKKHGPHSLRFSLAYRMLKGGETLPSISQVLGHKSAETTKGYLKIDIGSLKLCPLPMPPLNSIFYKKEPKKNEKA